MEASGRWGVRWCRKRGFPRINMASFHLPGASSEQGRAVTPSVQTVRLQPRRRSSRAEPQSFSRKSSSPEAITVAPGKGSTDRPHVMGLGGRLDDPQRPWGPPYGPIDLWEGVRLEG